MKKLLTFAFAAFCAAATAYAQPKIQVAGGDTHDWGKVKPTQSPLSTVLKITNAGNEELKINDVKVGCGCTTTGLEKKELAPGETTSMTVSLNVGTNTGGVTKSVSILSNDPETPTKLVLLKAEVVRALQFVPAQYLSFTDMKLGSESTAKVTIKNLTNEDIVLSDIETTNGIKHNLKGQTTIKANSDLEIVARVKPQQKGYFNGTLKMKSSNAEMPVIEISAWGQVPDATSPVFMNK
ncbi:MAG TPA: DUF1573 domain-containing protein [Patescibacteria group bacterium]|nr:DUF1573 domain-containing protein [Patescibacteria group bacterium]